MVSMFTRSWMAAPCGAAPFGKLAAQLQLHQIDAPHLLGDGVLDLKARIGLDEEEVVAVDQELEGAEAAILHGLGHRGRRIDDLLAHRRLQVRAGRQLDDLLAAALQGAFALAQRRDAALAVTDDLHLDVARLAHQPLGIESAVAEGRLRLGRRTREGIGDVAFVRDQPHAAPAAAGDRLERDAGLCMLLEERRRAGDIDRAVGARQHRHLALLGLRSRARLVAEQLELLRRRADEGDLRLGAGARQPGILRQEAVARMDRVAPAALGRRDHGGDIEIGRRAAPAQRHRLVDPLHVQRGGVVLGKDADRGDAQLRRRLGDADGDLAAIGDQKSLDHVRTWL